MCARTLQVIPILRIFSVEKAREFYLDYAGFRVDWEHRFDPTHRSTCRFPAMAWCCTFPSIMAMARREFGARSCFRVFASVHAELATKNYPYWRPGITETFWGTEQLNLLDPFGNKISLCEPKPDDAAS